MLCKLINFASWSLKVSGAVQSWVALQCRGFIKRSYARSMPLFRDMFMSSDIPEKDLER